MNEDINMPNDNSVNQPEDSNYPNKFDPNTSDKENNYAQNKDSTDYLGRYQLNKGKRLVRTNSPSSLFAKNPYGNGIRGRIGSIGNSNGYWGRGAISVLGIAIILGILVLVITFLAK